MQNNQSGISFIEILVALLLISMLSSMLIPRLTTQKPQAVQKKFFSDFAALLHNTAYQAIVTQKVHQIVFYFKTKKIVVKEHVSVDKETESNPAKHFRPLDERLEYNSINIPDAFTIKNLIVDKTESILAGMSMDDAWFYVMPDGSCQAVICNIEQETHDQTLRFSITVSPFYSQANLHDTFQS